MRAASLVGLSGLFVTLWSSGWLASQLVMEQLSVVTLLNARYLIVLLALLLIVTAARQWRRLSIRNLSGQLCVGALSHGLYLMAALGALQQGVSAGLVTFVITLHPIATALLSGCINNEKFSTHQWQGLSVACLAVLVLISQSHDRGASGLALTLPLLAVTALTLGTLLNRHLELENQSGTEPVLPVFFLLLIQSVGALMLLLPIGMLQGGISLDFDTRQWGLLLWLALLASLGAYAVLQLLLRNLPSTRVACLTYLVPPVTLLQIYLVFGETLDATELSAMLLAAAGVLRVMASPGERQSETREIPPCVPPELRQQQSLMPSTLLTINSRHAVDIEL